MSYGRVSNQAVFYPGLSLEAKGLYGIVCSLCGTKNYCYPSVQTLVQLSGKSRSTVQRLLAELSSKGVIKRSFDPTKNLTITVHLMDKKS
jgi:DNA-binding MarR family transcriptional regulator